MFGSEAIPALLLLGLMFLVPESPRWLCKRGLIDQARRVLIRVDGAKHAERELAEIETALAEESGSMSQLFRPGLRMVLVIGVLLAVLQQVTGINVFLYYAPVIFTSVAGAAGVVLLVDRTAVAAFA